MKVSICIYSLGCWLLFSAAATAMPRKAVFTGVELAGRIPDKEKWRREYNYWAQYKLQQLSFQPVSFTSDPIHPELDNCHQESCFIEIAKRAGADVVISSRIANDQKTPQGYLISVELYDAVKKPTLRSRESSCESCSEIQAKSSLLTLIGDVINETSTPSFNPIDLNITDVNTANRKKRIAGYTIGGVGAALLVAGVVGLAVTIPMHGSAVCDGTPSPDVPCHDRTNAIPGIVISAVGLGVGAVLTPLGFALAHKYSAKQKVSLTVSPNGLGILAKGTF